MLNIKILEMLQELPKCDTETRREQMLLEKWYQETCWCGVATHRQFIKNVMSVKCNTVKCNKMKYACIVILVQ